MSYNRHGPEREFYDLFDSSQRFPISPDFTYGQNVTFEAFHHIEKLFSSNFILGSSN